MASIKKYVTKDGNKRYMFRIYLGIDPKTGRKKQTTRRGFKTQKEAKLEISKLQLQLEKDGEIKKQNKRTYQNVYDEFVESYRLTVRESTLRVFNSMTRIHVLPAFGDKLIDKITPSDIQTIINKWSKQLSSFSIIFSMLKRVFTFAYKRGYIDKNPADLIIMPKNADRDKKTNFYTKDELIEFFNIPYFEKESRKQIVTFFRLLAFSGIRKSEGLALKWSDVNFDNKSIEISKTLSRRLKTGDTIQKPKTQSGNRTVILDDKTIQILKEWRVVQRQSLLIKGINILGKDTFIFTADGVHPHGDRLANEWLKRAYKTTNMRQINVHGFRHTHASMLFAAGVPIKEVQERLGHSDPSMTLRVYTHVSKEQHLDAVNKLSNYADF